MTISQIKNPCAEILLGSPRIGTVPLGTICSRHDGFFYINTWQGWKKCKNMVNLHGLEGNRRKVYLLILEAEGIDKEDTEAIFGPGYKS